MKQCTYCGKEYPDEASLCAIDAEPLRVVMALPPVEPASPVMTAPNITHRRIAQGTLSLGSFIKLSVIAAIGCLPVVVVLFSYFQVGLARGDYSKDNADRLDFWLWPFLHLNVITSAVIVVGSGFFAGLCGYPFYARQCRRRGGINVLKGKFEVLRRANDGEPLRDVMPPPPVAPASPVMTAPNIAYGRLSLGSFIKLSVIAAYGCLPVLAVLSCLAFLVGLAQGRNSDIGIGILLLPVLVPFLLSEVITSAVIAAVIVVGSGFFAGLCGYPFYAWLCRRRGGIVLKGEFEVL